MANFHLTEMAIKRFCPGNVAQTDDAGLPSLLVYIPAFKNSDVLTGGNDSIHPAFIVNGVQIPGFYFAKYKNVVHNGMAYSLPGETVPENMSFNRGVEYSEAKGYGWHLATNAEWAAIALWCKKNGTLPYGNNDYGKDARESDYKAIPATYTSDGANTATVATGTGPLKWSHDRSMSGIWDLNGNSYEFVGGVRLVYNELQIIQNNDAADPDNPQNKTSTCWKAINAADGSLVEPECQPTDSAAKLDGSTIKLDLVNQIWTYCTSVTNTDDVYGTCQFAALACSDEISDAAKNLLRALALLPEEGGTTSDYDNDEFYADRSGNEQMLYRGGTYSTGAGSGVFRASFAIKRTTSVSNAAFRTSYIPNI